MRIMRDVRKSPAAFLMCTHPLGGTKREGRVCSGRWWSPHNAGTICSRLWATNDKDNTVCWVGGFDGSTGLNSAEMYDSKAHEWRMIAPMSTRRSSVGVGVVSGLLYAVSSLWLKFLCVLFVLKKK
ncbi:Ring canal kelch [Portunus trituberculatus]|uniref:Ring canal kelch n=1 Tax=Portunus trituberculatus TaxID=210409 RepID=A0A5B7G2N9_PORTR|nr:Ring canal kelch [Portunus trituberculatus]